MTSTATVEKPLSPKQEAVRKDRAGKQLLDATGRKVAVDTEAADADVRYRGAILTAYNAGWTYDELAEMAGCSRWWIAKLLRAERDAEAEREATAKKAARSRKK